MTLDILGRVLLLTDKSYHQKVAGNLIDIVEALYEEKKASRAETFKSRIILKCSYMIGLLC
jgi:hypothetical protein